MGVFSKLLHKREEKKKEQEESEITKNIGYAIPGPTLYIDKLAEESKKTKN